MFPVQCKGREFYGYRVSVVQVYDIVQVLCLLHLRCSQDQNLDEVSKDRQAQSVSDSEENGSVSLIRQRQVEFDSVSSVCPSQVQFNSVCTFSFFLGQSSCYLL